MLNETWSKIESASFEDSHKRREIDADKLVEIITENLKPSKPL